MNFLKKFFKGYEIEHMQVTFLSPDDLALAHKKKVRGNLDISGLGNYRAKKLATVDGNLLVADSAVLFAQKLQTVTQNLYAVNTHALNLPQLKQAHCVYISNVSYIHLPNLQNSRVVISKNCPIMQLDIPAGNVIEYADTPVSLDGLRKILADQITQRMKNSRKSH
ncbi:hypothetical protein HDR63_02130 [bacterium]|nr:hypothetical protein [bacterium]